MNDDLVERLRATCNCNIDTTPCLAEEECRVAQEAADRIEELEAKLTTCEKYRDAYAECDRIGTQSVRELEAKLAKAVEALEWVKFGGGPTGESYHLNAVDTLAELTGGKDE